MSVLDHNTDCTVLTPRTNIANQDDQSIA